MQHIIIVQDSSHLHPVGIALLQHVMRKRISVLFVLAISGTAVHDQIAALISNLQSQVLSQ